MLKIAVNVINPAKVQRVRLGLKKNRIKDKKDGI
jgi:hypothetical protein